MKQVLRQKRDRLLWRDITPSLPSHPHSCSPDFCILLIDYAHEHAVFPNHNRPGDLSCNPVETLLDGTTIDEVLADYEDLERDDLLAVLACAVKLARTRRVQPGGFGL